MAQTFHCDGHVGRNMQHTLTLNYVVKLLLLLMAFCFFSCKEVSKLLSVSSFPLNAFLNERYFFGKDYKFRFHRSCICQCKQFAKKCWFV
jgi:hypothetical protein